MSPVSNDVTLETIEQNIDQISKNILENGVASEDLNIIKSKAKLDLEKYLDGIENQSIAYAILIANGAEIGYFHNLSNKIDKVTLKQVNLALQELLHSRKIIGFLKGSN